MCETSSDEDENLDILRESVDKDLINDDMFKSEDITESTSIKLPSLRPLKDDRDHFNLLDVTPEFQIFVGKQLTKLLDRKLENKLTSKHTESKSKAKNSSGIKLFSDSEDFICDNFVIPDIKIKKCEIKRRIIENDKMNDDEKVRLCSVNSEDILNKKEVKFWTERRKGEIFRYKRTKKGQFMLIEEGFR